MFSVVRGLEIEENTWLTWLLIFLVLMTMMEVTLKY